MRRYLTEPDKKIALQKLLEHIRKSKAGELSESEMIESSIKDSIIRINSNSELATLSSTKNAKNRGLTYIYLWYSQAVEESVVREIIPYFEHKYNKNSVVDAFGIQTHPRASCICNVDASELNYPHIHYFMLRLTSDVFQTQHEEIHEEFWSDIENKLTHLK